MKKIITSILSFAICLMLIQPVQAAAPKQSVNVKKLVLYKDLIGFSSCPLRVAKTGLKTTWKSSNKKIARIARIAGKYSVQAEKTGKCTITCTSGGQKIKIPVTVKAKPKKSFNKQLTTKISYVNGFGKYSITNKASENLQAYIQCYIYDKSDHIIARDSFFTNVKAKSNKTIYRTLTNSFGKPCNVNDIDYESVEVIASPAYTAYSIDGIKNISFSTQNESVGFGNTFPYYTLKYNNTNPFRTHDNFYIYAYQGSKLCGIANFRIGGNCGQNTHHSQLAIYDNQHEKIKNVEDYTYKCVLDSTEYDY